MPKKIDGYDLERTEILNKIYLSLIFCTFLVYDIRRMVLLEAKYRKDRWTALWFLLGIPQESIHSAYTPKSRYAGGSGGGGGGGYCVITYSGGNGGSGGAGSNCS